MRNFCKTIPPLVWTPHELCNLSHSIDLGRSIPDIKTKVSIKNITYAGNHGIDIVHPDGSKVTMYSDKYKTL